jgi:predicted ATPase
MQSPPPDNVIVLGYKVVQEIVRNDLFALYRCQRDKDNKSVLLKILHTHLSDSIAVEMLEREFEILRALKIEGVPQCLELNKENARLVLEDNGGMPLKTLFDSEKLNLESFFKLAIQLANILTELHKQEIILHNINPNAILINPETNKIFLTDFSFATSQNNNIKTMRLPLSQHSFLSYVSPEQTGRMNRTVDYRTDFYSLGVLFYELLTGNLPFLSDDPLELIHAHIAKTPLTPTEINSEIPETVSKIVMKLLAKTAEQRYQSAAGLKADLEICAREWAAHREVMSFPLGLHDVSDRFNIPQKLYGRKEEVEHLLDTFDRVCEGTSAMMLVAGYSGIGKTSLIQELYKPIVRERGYFISGKFDQVARGIPFGALIQAFRSLVRQLLTESDERLEMWRTRLLNALGANGGVLTEVIPEIELIIGKQSLPLALGPTEAVNRFQLVFQNFVGALAQQGHPLVLFLDDLQWADSATLSLLQPLLTSQNIQHFFLIGAYRDNEVDATHLLTRTLNALETAGVELPRIALGALQLSDLTHFTRDTLHGELTDAAPLAELTLQKTSGNPFFVVQFLKMLQQEEFLKFDYALRRWTYRLEDIKDAAMTDNVIDLMTRKVQRLSDRTQRALMLASCIGNSFDQQTLSVVSEQSLEEVSDNLKEAINEGLIVPTTNESRTQNLELRTQNSFVFLHDRVQQAVYALIPDERKQTIHLTVGRLLYEREFRVTPSGVISSDAITPEGVTLNSTLNNEKLFDIVHHLNLGRSLITEESERLSLAKLNLSAGRKSKSSTAYQAALDYFKIGASLLDEERWASDYELAFALNCEAAECQYLCGNFDEAEQAFESLLKRARTKLDKARIYQLRGVQYENQARYAEVIESARECLALFDVHFPDSTEEKEVALENEIESIKSLLGQRSIESLIDLPVMTDAETRMVMSLLTDIWASAYILGDAVLARLISATMVRLSLIHGNVEESAYGYVTHAITVGPVREDYKSAYEFGRLALQVNERFNDSRRRAKIHQQFHAHVALWRKPFQVCIKHAQEACRSGLEAGDFLYASYGAFTETWPAIVATQDLKQFIRDYTPSLALIRKLKVHSFADAHQLVLNWAKALQDETESKTSLSDEQFDEKIYLEKYSDNPFFSLFYYTAKMQIAYLLEEYEQASVAANRVRQIVQNLSGMIWTPLFDFWGGLVDCGMRNAESLSAECGVRSAELNTNANQESNNKESEVATQQTNPHSAFRIPHFLGFAEAAQKRLSVLAENCPENYLCMSLLLAAEIERVKGHETEATDLYEQAIRYADENKMVQYQALANELHAKFQLGRGEEKTATALLTKSHACYAQWGAKAKVKLMEDKYPHLLGRQSAKESTMTASDTGALDFFSAMKAAQTIAGEMESEKLLAKLIRIAIENAGAERGYLLLKHDDELSVYAEGSLNSVDVKIHDTTPFSEAQNLPHSIVNYVLRTSENVVLAEATKDDQYCNDPYILQHRIRSVMCVPVLNQGRMVGVLYLENNQIGGAFTLERIQVIQMLAAQAAISLKNAQLYDEMKEEATQRRQAEETLRSIMEGTAGVTGDNFFASMVRHLADTLQVRYAFVTECRDYLKLGAKAKAKMVAFWQGDRLAENVSYELASTPCLNVFAGQSCYYPRGVQQLFPDDKDLVALNAEGYLGIPLYAASKQVIGHLAILDDKPLVHTPQSESLLRIFAARAGAELERLHAEEELRVALTEVEKLKNRLHDENIYLQEEILQEHNFEEIIGNSPALLEALQKVERVATTDATVLITGETGTGKELIARAIHNFGTRKNRPLVKVNCGAISAGLVESELFGHTKGAFTGAIDKRTGRFELANGGTIFLDEVGELPLETQVKLLRVLQEGEFEPVGSSKTVKVDVRVIAATNRNLEDEIKAGKFRSDLFYRLNVFPIHSPSLRERREDIPQLVMFFLERFAKKFGKRVSSLPTEVMERLTSYHWLGNVRELQNIIERAVVLASPNETSLRVETIPVLHTETKEALAAQASSSNITTTSTVNTPARALEDVERQHILSTLEKTNWVIEGAKGAAQVLNLHPNTLRSRMKKLGIKRPNKKG